LQLHKQYLITEEQKNAFSRLRGGQAFSLKFLSTNNLWNC